MRFHRKSLLLTNHKPTTNLNYSEVLQSFHLSVVQWIAICFTVFLLGLSKSGIKGIGIIIVVILAFVFGEKTSTGILLPMLIFADIFAVIYYNKHAQWHYIKKLLPAMVFGVLVGVWVGNDISEIIFKRTMAVIVIGSVLIMFFMENRKSTAIPTNRWFSNAAGFLAGFTTMIGNLAGPISDIYFLAMRLPKNEFIGTAAWLFFIINLLKYPLISSLAFKKATCFSASLSTTFEGSKKLWCKRLALLLGMMYGQFSLAWSQTVTI
uniref:sulfite exporter TauE/SafE family protein n=1 Tax=Mariniflexile sp. TaxID=1979402 RepID=UPI0040484088